MAVIRARAGGELLPVLVETRALGWRGMRTNTWRNISASSCQDAPAASAQFSLLSQL